MRRPLALLTVAVALTSCSTRADPPQAESSTVTSTTAAAATSSTAVAPATEAPTTAAPTIAAPTTASPATAAATTSKRPPASVAAAPLPVARTEVAGALWQGKVVVAGGLTADGGASRDVDVYDAATRSWSSAPALPVGLHHLGLAVVGERLYAVGGFTGAPGMPWEAQSGVRSLGPREGSWRDEPPLAGARGGLAVTAVGGRLVAVGGSDERGQVLRRSEVLPPGGAAWEMGPDLTEPRDHLAAAAVGSRVLAMAGRQGSLESNLRTVESYEPGSDRGWGPEPQLNDARGGTSASTVLGRPCIAGGEGPRGTIGSVECLVDGRFVVRTMLRQPRHGVAVVARGDALHVIGGGPTPGLSVSTTHEVIPLG